MEQHLNHTFPVGSSWEQGGSWLHLLRGHLPVAAFPYPLSCPPACAELSMGWHVVGGCVGLTPLPFHPHTGYC